MADVFISHSSKDKDTADKVVAYLEERGISCWIAPRNIVAGSDWAAAISSAITSIKIFLLIYSENSSASEQVAREMNLAETVDGVFVVPYKIDETPLTGTYQYYLTGAHWIMADVAKDDYKLDELHLMISGIIEKGVQNSIYAGNLVNGPSSADKSSKGSKKTFIIAGAIGAAALTGIIVAAVLLLPQIGRSEPPESEATTAQSTTGITTDTVVEESPSFGTITNYKLIYNSIVIDGTYTGELNPKGQPEGKGEFKGIYTVMEAVCDVEVTGEFSNGMLNGSAYLVFKSMGGTTEKHESDSFVDGKVNGIKKSTAIESDGTETIAEIEMIHGIPNGHGKEKIKYPNGNTETIEGEYADSKMNGEGIVVINYVEGSSNLGIKTRTYNGNFKNDIKSGKGVMTTEYYDGTVKVYEGDFEGNDFYGQGTLVQTNPESTKGSDVKQIISAGVYMYSVMNGPGKRTTEYVNGVREVYEGDFANDVYEGEGTVTFYYTEENDLKTITYTGGFKEGIFEGKGKKTLEYNDGDKEIMEGDWKNGVSNGSVCYDCLYVVPPDGTNTIRELYNGYMKDGIRNGMGTQKFYYDNGTVVTMTGEWDNNSMTDGSTVTYQDANGNIFKSGIWKNGTIEVQKSKGE